MNQHLPPGLRMRTSRAGVACYYLKLSGQEKEIALGPDKREALNRWQQHCLARFARDLPVDGLVRLIDCFIECAIPLRDPDARPALQSQAGRLRQFFLSLGNPRPGDPLPSTEAYFEHQGTARRHRGGAEIYLFVHIWSWAQRAGLLPTETPIPWRSDTVAVARRQEISNELGEAVRVLRNMNPAEADIGDDAARDQRPLKALQQQIAAQLAAEGRRDLAQHLRSLDGTALKAVLFNESVRTVESASSLILGAQRSDRLRALRREANQARRQTPDHDE
jgi:hypothetical protein